MPYQIKLQQYLDILDQVIEEYPTSTTVLFWSLLHKHKVYAQRLNYHINTIPNQDIIDRIKLLKELEFYKLSEGMCDANGNIPYNGAQFQLKVNHKVMEHKDKLNLKLQKEKMYMDANNAEVMSDINVNFTTATVRSDADIQKLIDGE